MCQHGGRHRDEYPGLCGWRRRLYLRFFFFLILFCGEGKELQIWMAFVSLLKNWPTTTPWCVKHRSRNGGDEEEKGGQKRKENGKTKMTKKIMEGCGLAKKKGLETGPPFQIMLELKKSHLELWICCHVIAGPIPCYVGTILMCYVNNGANMQQICFKFGQWATDIYLFRGFWPQVYKVRLVQP